MRDWDKSTAARFGRFLRRKREEAGLNALEVARRTQQFPKPMRISQSYLSEIESKGSVPSPFKLISLARLYKITIAEIYRVLGAADLELGAGSSAVLAERTLYSNLRHRQIHKEVQKLLNAGLEQPVSQFVRGAGEVLIALEPSMQELALSSRAESAAILVNGNRLVFEYQLSPQDRQLILDGGVGRPEGWREYSEGEADGFRLQLLLKHPRINDGLDRDAEVAVIRWWAGLRGVLRGR